MVSLQAPDRIRLAQIRQEYKIYITSKLLEKWTGTSDPASVPGREVSSPWPDRISIRHIDQVHPGQVEVDAEIIYITSVEMTQGGIAAREKVSLTLVKSEGNHWLINAWKGSPGSKNP